MNLAILASVLIFAFVLSIGIKKSNKEIEQAKEDFWSKEYKSNFVRKKSLDDLEYITIPEEFYSYNYDLNDSRVNDAKDTLIHLKDCTIVNFSGITNTDLKLKYGTANITVLSEYDLNYTALVKSLQTLAESLYNLGQISEAVTLLEFAVDTRTDMSSTYKLLGNAYTKDGLDDLALTKIDMLIEKVSMLDGLMKSSIIEYLEGLKN